MTPRPPLLIAALTLGLLVGCSNRTTSEPRSAESGGTPPAQMETPPTDKPAQPPAAKDSEEAPSGGTAAAPAPDRGPAVFFIRDSGVRCMTTPCPFFIATRPDRPGVDGVHIHEVDLSALNFSDEKRNLIMEATHAGPGLKVEATMDTVPNAGPAGAATVLRVTRLVEGK
ncbi:hypothetical protein [Archangium sp.]|uniref:hypothetical protein n=1 Tax=Archangium sp. TaxID=1872627 RepID=UPI002D267CE8|nr:hypothetical protein [Archangium sp.]HYO57128.1 hypothetical protein [Archangium sp.]